ARPHIVDVGPHWCTQEFRAGERSKEGHLSLFGERHRRSRGGGTHIAKQHEDLLLIDQPLRRLNGLLWLITIVQREQTNFPAVDTSLLINMLKIGSSARFHFLTQALCRPSERTDLTDAYSISGDANLGAGPSEAQPYGADRC